MPSRSAPPAEPATAAPGGAGAPPVDPALRASVLESIRRRAVVRGEVVLSAGEISDYYVDLRRLTLAGATAPQIGRALRALTVDWDYAAVGGLTLGADPVATAMVHAAAAEGAELDAFVVRRQGKAHGLQRRVEGPEVAGRRLLVVEDTSTTGASALAAVSAVREAGGEPIGVAVVLDRGGAAAVRASGLPCRALFEVSDLGPLRAPR